MVLNLPTTLAIDMLAISAHGLVGNDGEVAGGLVAQELLQQGTDNGSHSRGEDDNGNIVFLGPVVEFFEVWVQLHVLQQRVDALVVWGLDAIKHLAKGISIMKKDSLGIACGMDSVFNTHRKLKVSSRTWSLNARRFSRPKPMLSI